MKNIKIYIPHYTKLHERKQPMIDEMTKAGFSDYVFYEKYDQEDILEQEFAYDEAIIRIRTRQFIPEQVISKFLEDRFTPGEKSIALKHKYIYKDFLENASSNDNLLILEDDVRLAYNIKHILNAVINKSVYDCINLSAGGSKHLVPTEQNQIKQIQLLNIAHHPFSTGIDSYLLSYECVEKIWKELSKVKITIPIDWELSYIFMKQKMNCVRMLPPLAYQGSMTGIYKSSIREDRSGY
jgi:GR25 family glycosyltransferase involved in LPS biosynthesis